jgi:hypothetical protein
MRMPSRQLQFIFRPTYGDQLPQRATLLTARLKSSPYEIPALLALAFAYMLILYLTDDYDTLNFYGPAALTAILGHGAWYIAAAQPVGIWTSLFWLRIASGLYYGFGGIVPFLVNATTMEVMANFHKATPEQMYKVNLLTTIGILFIIGSARLTEAAQRPIRIDRKMNSSDDDMLMWGIILGGCGVVIKYLITIPYNFGLLQWTVPGIVLQLSMTTSVGIYLVGSWAITRSRGLFIAVAGFAAFDALLGLLTFAKLDVLFTLIMIGLTFVHKGVSIRRITILTVSLFSVFVFIAPIVDYGRTTLIERYQSISGAGFGERIDIVKTYFSGGKEHFLASDFRSEFQGGLARLSYMNQSAFAVALYDNGHQGDSIEAIAVVLIPRFLWPDKPNMNYLTAGFTQLATGGLNLTWPGRYTEVYWNWGWWGILLLLPPLGIIYALLSRFALWVFLTRKWVYFPVVLMSMRYGLEITSPYATAGVGGLLQILPIYLVAKACDLVFSSRLSKIPPFPHRAPHRARRT